MGLLATGETIASAAAKAGAKNLLEDPKELQFLMNTNAARLARQQRMGGFPMPSLAVTKQSIPFDSYGDITLVGNPELFNPKSSRSNQVFDADAYTIRAPELLRLAKKGSYKKLLNEFKSLSKSIDRDYEVVEGAYHLEDLETKTNADGSGFRKINDFFENSEISDAAFLKEKGIEIPRDKENELDRFELRGLVDELREEKKAWSNSKLNEYFEPQEYFISNPNRDYVTGRPILKEYTAEEVTKWMKKHAGRSQENSFVNASVGSQRASTTGELKTLDAMRKKSSQLQDSSAVLDAKNINDKKFFSLVEDLKPNYEYDAEGFRYFDTVGQMIIDSEKMGLDRALKNNDFNDLSQSQIDKIIDYKNTLRESPTQYFEAKPKRVVDFSEFEGAIVPLDTPKETLDMLKEAGVKVETYGDATERLNKRKKFAGTAFSVGGGMVLVGSAYDTQAGVLSSGARRLLGSEVKLTAEEIAKEAESLGFIVGDARGGKVNNSSTPMGNSSYIPVSYTAPNGRTISTEVRVSDHGTGPVRSGNYLHVQSMEDASKALSSLKQKKLETESLKPLEKQFNVNQPDSKSRKFVDNKGLNEDQLLQLSQARSYGQAKEILLSATNLDKQQIGSIENASDTKIGQAVGYAINKNKGSATLGGLLGAGAVGAAATPTFQDKAVAVGETLLDAGQAMIAPMAAAPHALIPALTRPDYPASQIEQNYQNLLQQMNYQPSTPLGQEYSQQAQQFMGDAFNAAAQSAPGQAIEQFVEPINLLMQQAPQRARTIGRSLLDMSPF